MNFHAIGMNYRHDADFRVDRPYGSGDELLLIFLTSAVIYLDGDEISAPPHSTIIFREGFPQHYSACGQKYINHFLHFDCSDDHGFVSDAGLAFNTVIPLADISGAEDNLRMISRRCFENSPFQEKYMDMLIKMLILSIAESSSGENSARISTPHSSALTALRAELYTSAGSYRSVSDLARKVNLSPSHFQKLYCEQFGVSCYEDMLCARVKAAEYYLKSTDLSVREISVLCGYENDVVFMRRFRQRTGMTPTEYRQGSRQLI